MTTAREAEEYVQKWYKDRNISISKVKGEHGFDFRDESGKIFVEVKGTSAANLSEMSWYFTNSEYMKAKECIRNNEKRYEIHLVHLRRDGTKNHYRVNAQTLIDKAKPEIQWLLPLRKNELENSKEP
jgi:hypothetical protein